LKLKGKFPIYFILATGLPLLITVLILYFYLIGGLRRIETENVISALSSVKAGLETEGESIAQRVGRIARADNFRLLQVLLARDKAGHFDQSKLIELVGEYQKLLKLDVLEVISKEGLLLASGDRPTDFGRESEFSDLLESLDSQDLLGFVPYTVGERMFLAYISGQALKYHDSAVALILGGSFIDSYFLLTKGCIVIFTGAYNTSSV